MSDNIDKDKQVRRLNTYLIILLVFTFIWSISTMTFVKEKKDVVKSPVPIIKIDTTSGQVINTSYTNSTKILNNGTNKVVEVPLFKRMDSYKIQDFVIINYFFVEGIVVSKIGKNYTVMYKDNNDVLQTVAVPQEMLLVPTSSKTVLPFSLLAD